MAFEVLGNGILWRGDGETVRIEAWGRGIRVRAAVMAEIRDVDFALLDDIPTAGFARVEGAVATVTAGGTTVVAEEETAYHWSAGFHRDRLRLRFQDAEGRVVLEEIGDGGALMLKAREYRPSAFGGAALRARFASDPDEHIAGMGLYQQPFVDLKGTTLELAHRNSQTSVPFLQSSSGYGFLWNNPATGTATFGRNYTEWTSAAADQLDYWVTVGATPREISDAYAEVTGRPPMMPEHGLGFWQCKLRYWNQEQLLEVAREHHRRGIPLDVIVADFFHWQWMGDYSFEEEFWPDPAAMVRELKELGVELMVSVWPQVSPNSDNFLPLQRENLLVKTRTGIDVQYHFVDQYTRFLDVTNPRARTWLWERLRESYGRHGIDLFWLDEAEPEYGAYEFDHYLYAAGPTAKVANIYPRDFVRAIGEGQRANGNDRPLSLVRAAWAGSQRHGALIWSGDVHSTWHDLRAQITAGIHMGVAGIPWFTTDIGGFTGGWVDDPAFRELLVRWFQFGAFSPVMRLHGDRRPQQPVATATGEYRLESGADNEVWTYGPEIEETLVSYIRLREALRPYTRALMAEAHEHGTPVLRGLFYEFPDDARCWEVGDQFLFGADVLVAPVLEPGAVERDVYLPAGAAWTDARTGESFDGGRTIRVAAPLASVPVFARTPEALALLDAMPGRLA